VVLAFTVIRTSPTPFLTIFRPHRLKRCRDSSRHVSHTFVTAIASFGEDECRERCAPTPTSTKKNLSNWHFLLSTKRPMTRSSYPCTIQLHPGSITIFLNIYCSVPLYFFFLLSNHIQNITETIGISLTVRRVVRITWKMRVEIFPRHQAAVL
jgi:hypothetical protein